MKRKNLPYRKNCEGYFLYKNKYIVAKDTRKGYVVFPGGGVDSKENPKEALIRESMEEAGIVCDNIIKKIGVLRFDWGPDWAKTRKQKKRYSKFRGEEMHFFVGTVKGFVKPKGDPSDAWKGKKYLLITDAIRLIEKTKPFDKEIEKYRIKQLKTLYSLK